MKRAFIFNTGCIRRALDSTRVHSYLIKNGWSFTNNLSAADLVVISTCGAVQDDEDFSLDILRTVAEKKAASAQVLVTGCLPKIAPDGIQTIRGAMDFEYIPTRNLDKLDSVLDSTVRFEDVPDVNLVTNDAGLLDFVLGYRLVRHSFLMGLYKRMSLNRRFLRGVVVLSETVNSTRRRLGMSARPKIAPYYNLRIAEGCAFACSFCAIQFATGRVKSKPVERIVEEFKAGLAEGHKIFQLVCEDVGCYGIDIGTTFPSLLRRLLEVEGDYQIVFIDFGGYWLVKYYDELLPLFLEHPHKVRELYVSLQTGSDKILKAMRRPEKGEEVRARLKALKKELPHLTLRTTVIIGFPGETEEDFLNTLDAVQEIDFSIVELNKYTDRPGTASSKMNNKIPQEIIDRRTEEIAHVLSRR